MNHLIKSLAFACTEYGLLYLSLFRRVDGAENVFIALQWLLTLVYFAGMIFGAVNDKFLTELASKPRGWLVAKWFYRAYNLLLLVTLVWNGWWMCAVLAFASIVFGSVLSIGVNEKREKLAKEKANTTGHGF